MQANCLLFNPTGEMAIANNTPSYQPPRMLQQFEAALCTVPAFLGTQDDVCFCAELPPAEFRDFWAKMGVKLGHLVNLNEALADANFVSAPRSGIRPWCWSAAAHHLLAGLKASCGDVFRASPNATWSHAHRMAYSRLSAQNLLFKLLHSSENGCYIDRNDLPVVARSLAEVEARFALWPQMVLKAPWSSSGRGVQMLRQGSLDRARAQWTIGVLEQQGFVMVEKLFDKKLDFSIQFELSSDSVRPLGMSIMATNSNGGYLGNYVGFSPKNNSIFRDFLLQNLENIRQDVAEILHQMDLRNFYQGTVGVDMMVVEEADKLRIHPCVEINLRPTMGLLSLEMGAKIHPEAHGLQTMFFNPKENFEDFSRHKLKNNPPQVCDGMPRKGIFVLSPIWKSQFGIYLELF